MAAIPTFSDTFNTLSLWNGSSGTWATDYWYDPLQGAGNTLASNGEQEWYINSNDPATNSVIPWTVKNGILTITGSATPSAIQPLVNGYQYVSGELNGYHSFSQTYGFFEARMQLPAGQGLWPAFWMIPENGSWPPEIDIMEMLGNDPTTYYTSVHSGTASAEVSAGQADHVADTSKAYHEFAVDWTPTTLTYYFDNKPVYSTPTPSDMNVPMYMELNLAMGGGWPGNINSTTPLPAQMRVANVQAYASNPLSNLSSVTINATGAAGQVYIGQPGNDIFNVGTNAVTMTGDGLTNSYVFSALPASSPSHITDFDPGADTLDISTLLSSVGYTGSNPFSDGTVTVVPDGQGGAAVIYHRSSIYSAWIVDLPNVDPSSILNTDFAWNNTGTTGGSGSTSGGGSTGSGTPGAVLTANNTAGQTLTAMQPNVTFNAGQNSVVMTEDGGVNTFVYTALPYHPYWEGGHITNFNPALDKIDLTAVLQSLGYGGSNPFADGTLNLESDNHGGTDLIYYQGAPYVIVDLDNVSVAQINAGTDFVTGYNTSTGPTYTASNVAGQVIAATEPNATFNAGQNSVVMTEDGGANTFVYTALPYHPYWDGGHITNFNPASDKIDLTAVLQSLGYGGSNPFADGTLNLESDNHGGTDLIYYHGAPYVIVDLDNVSVAQINAGTDFVTGYNTSTGPTYTASNVAGQVIAATEPNATFNAGQNSVVMTEDGGANTFVYTALPYHPYWEGGHITNFNPASDKIDLTAVLQSLGYGGSNPFADGTLNLESDNHGGTDLIYYHGAPYVIADLDNASVAQINAGTDFVTGYNTSTGPTYTASNVAGQVIAATEPNATFNAGQNSVVMTEDGGANTFVYTALPYNAGHITNFNVALDSINVSALFNSVGYAGSNPFGDGTLSLSSDGAGGTNLIYNPPGAGSNGIWPIKLVDISHVAPTVINTSKDFILH